MLWYNEHWITGYEGELAGMVTNALSDTELYWDTGAHPPPLPLRLFMVA